METRMSGAERGAEETMMRNHQIGASASTLRVAKPSDNDKVLTCRLKEALALVEVQVLDHFVVAGAEILSFAEWGIL